LLARGDFDGLPIPFLAVATRLNDGRAVVLRTGDLARAVRASSAIPLVFDPVLIDGDRLVDGGLAANVPIAPARAAGVTQVLVSDVTEGLADTANLTSSVRLIGHLVSLLSTQYPDSLGPRDRYVRSNLTRYAALDFSPSTTDSLIAEGRRAAIAVLDSATCLPRRAARVVAVPTVVGKVRIDGGRAGTKGELERILQLSAGASIDLDRLRAGLYAFPAATRADAIWLSPSGAGDTADFAVVVEQQADLFIGLTAAYDHELGGRLVLGTVGQHRLGRRLTGSAVTSLDRFDQAVRLRLTRSSYWRGRNLSLGLGLEGDHRRIRAFDTLGDEQDAASTYEAFGVLRVDRELIDGWNGAAGIVGGVWNEPTRADATLGGFLRLTRVDGSGASFTEVEAAAMGISRRLSAVGQVPSLHLARGRFMVHPFARYGWGKQLPLQSTFPLGGVEGFPGLHLGERRGSREVAGGLQLRYLLDGALFLRASGMGGVTDGEGDAWPEADWLWGGRVGLGVETPLGGLRLEYGRNSLGRGAIFVRVGEW
jgi:NTE family protein